MAFYLPSALRKGKIEGPIQRLYRRIEIAGGLRGQTDNVDPTLGFEVNPWRMSELFDVLSKGGSSVGVLVGVEIISIEEGGCDNGKYIKTTSQLTPGALNPLLLICWWYNIDLISQARGFFSVRTYMLRQSRHSLRFDA